MATEEKKRRTIQEGKFSGKKLLTGALYVATALCILGFIVQSIASTLIVQ
ncbi:hypothetical protein ACFL7E_00355 [Thermodesulfobacteriota bacterium]